MRLVAPVTTGYFFFSPRLAPRCHRLPRTIWTRKIPLEPRVTSFWSKKNKLLFHRSVVNKGNSSTQCFFVKMKTGGYSKSFSQFEELKLIFQ